MADALIQEMQQLIGAWLERSDWSKQELIDWLQGFGLPSAKYGDEPFKWLLRGVPLAGERYHAEREFALRAAALLNEELDLRQVGRRPTELLYNLLELCAALSVPDHLADPLYEMFRRQALKGSWRGVDLRISLRRALIANQKDNRLEAVWQDMLSGSGHVWLLGDHYDGFEGARLQPQSPDSRGEPDTDAIGCALAAMTTHIENDRSCRVEFRRLISRVISTYPGRPSWCAELIEQADEKKFPTWAVSALPSLFVRLPHKEESSDEDVYYLLWNVFVPILKRINKPFVVERTLCDEGIVLEVRVAKDAEEELALASPLIEQRRISNPYKSYRAVVQSSYESLIRENGAVGVEGGSQHESNLRGNLSKAEMELYRESIIRDQPRVLSHAACAGTSSSGYITNSQDEGS